MKSQFSRKSSGTASETGCHITVVIITSNDDISRNECTF